MFSVFVFSLYFSLFLLHCAMLCKFPCKACLQTQRNVLFKASYEYSRPPESFGSNGAFSHSILSLQFFSCCLLQRPGKWSVILVYHSQGSSALSDCLIAALCTVRVRKAVRTFAICPERHTTIGKKEDVTKPMEAQKWSEWEMATSSRWWNA